MPGFIRVQIGLEMHKEHILSVWYSPFLRLESGRRVSWNEEERTHWVHVTKCWKKTHTYRESISIQETEHKNTNIKKNWYSRGAPSAISIAVIPQDQRSLCEERRHT